MLGGAAPPLLAGRWPAERLRALRLSVAFESSLGGGAPAPPHHPYWPAFGRREILERFGIRPRLYDTTPLISSSTKSNTRKAGFLILKSPFSCVVLKTPLFLYYSSADDAFDEIPS